MPAPVRLITDGADVPISTLSFPDVQAGVPTAPVTIRVHNNLGGAEVVDTLRGSALIGEAKLTGSPDDYQAEGAALLDADALQAKIVAASAGVELNVTDWTALGGGVRLPLPELPGTIGGEYVELWVRLNLPIGVTLQDTTCRVALDESLFGALPSSHLPNVIPTGLGDSTVSEVIDGAPLVYSGTPFELTSPLVTWHHQGRGPWPQQAGPIVFDDLDFNGDALLAGEAYVALLSRRRAAGLQVTKGIKATTPLTDANRPAVPVGDEVHAWVEVPFDGVLVVTEPTTSRPGYWKAYPSGLALSIGKGRAFVEGADVRRETETDLGSLPPDAVRAVYLDKFGGLALVDEAAEVPVGRPLLLYTAITDPTDIVEVIDHRPIERGGFTSG